VQQLKPNLTPQAQEAITLLNMRVNDLITQHHSKFACQRKRRTQTTNRTTKKQNKLNQQFSLLSFSILNFTQIFQRNTLKFWLCPIIG
jgi:hypothetical protein